MKQARIKCPHCGGNITIRQVEGQEVPAADAAKIWAASDKVFEASDSLFKAMDQMFAKVFKRRAV